MNEEHKYSAGRPATTRPILIRVPTDVKRQLERIKRDDETLGAVVRRLLRVYLLLGGRPWSGERLRVSLVGLVFSAGVYHVRTS